MPAIQVTSLRISTYGRSLRSSLCGWQRGARLALLPSLFGPEQCRQPCDVDRDPPRLVGPANPGSRASGSKRYTHASAPQTITTGGKTVLRVTYTRRPYSCSCWGELCRFRTRESPFAVPLRRRRRRRPRTNSRPSGSRRMRHNGRWSSRRPCIPAAAPPQPLSASSPADPWLERCAAKPQRPREFVANADQLPAAVDEPPEGGGGGVDGAAGCVGAPPDPGAGAGDVLLAHVSGSTFRANWPGLVMLPAGEYRHTQKFWPPQTAKAQPSSRLPFQTI